LNLKPRRLFYIGPLIVWMSIIFVMSSRVGESDKSGGLLNALIARVSPTFYHTLTEYQLECLNYGFRKACHVTEYAILTFLVARAFRFGKRSLSGRTLCLSLFVAVGYACTDEFHQSFVPGRTASVEDVLIDSCGVLAALLLISIQFAYRGVEQMVNNSEASTSPAGGTVPSGSDARPALVDGGR
jgi:VanZ family protein